MISTMIFDESIRMQIKSAHLAAKIRLDMLTFQLGALFDLALQFTLEQAPTQHTHGSFFVLEL